MEKPKEILELEEEIKLDVNRFEENALKFQERCYSTNESNEVIFLRLNRKGRGWFPISILYMSSLKRLELINLGLYKLPEEISFLDKLEYLILSGNNIKELPVSISQLYNLKKIIVKGNPILNPPPEILAQGSKGIRLFLSSKSGIFKSLKEVKLILVGDGSSGKTSLLKRLTVDEFDLNEIKTHGVRITDQNVYVERESYKLNYWDFGGQEIMHSTHQFFLSKRSLYLLVLDGRKEEDPEYWLKHIKLFGGDSPVLIVLNKYDDHPSFDVNRKFLLEKYRNIHGFIKVSCKNRYGLDELMNHIKREIVKIAHISTKWPSEWFNIKQNLESIEQDYISYDTYTSICKQYNLNDSESQQSLLEFLHDLGVILHFDEIDLAETNVINPRWITKGVYDIINSKSIAENNGILHLKELSKILPQDKYPRIKHGYVVGLMKKFELCYDLNNREILVPDLLDIQEPTIPFRFFDSLSYLIQYTLVPKSIIPRFIVNTHHLIEQNLRWRTGVILSDEDLNSVASIRVDYQENKIEIKVSGENRIEFFAIIRSKLNEIHRTFNDLNYIELIPCNCSDCMNSPSPYYFSYKTLLKSKSKKRSFLPCLKSIEDVDIIKLLKGIDMKVNNINWDVFISYSSKDIIKIQSLTKRLSENRVSYWLDREQIKPGESIIRKIENGINNSGNLILCLSHNQLESGWSRAEYSAILNPILSKKTDKRIIPLILEDEVLDNIPALLIDLKYSKLEDEDSLNELIESLK